MKEKWLEEGYRTFAYRGPDELRVERIAKGLERNKSGFYHYFSDMEIFREQLLKKHMETAHLIAEKEALCRSPEDLVRVIIEHKTDLLFNRQLRIHRQNKDYAFCFEKTNRITSEATLKLWSEILELSSHPQLAGTVLEFAVENFYLRITQETLNEEWLSSYFKEVKKLVRQFKNAKNLSSPDANV